MCKWLGVQCCVVLGAGVRRIYLVFKPILPVERSIQLPSEPSNYRAHHVPCHITLVWLRERWLQNTKPQLGWVLQAPALITGLDACGCCRRPR
jgi:hypothetical protein